MNKVAQVLQLSVLAFVFFVMMAGSAGAARADEGQPVMAEPDGVTAAADFQTTAAPVAADYQWKIYVSAPGKGKVAGIQYDDEDIMMYDTGTNTWAKAFDGTNAGLPAAADIDALAYSSEEILYSSYYISFDKPVKVPGLGKVDDSDIVLRSCFLGSCSWSLFFDGSQYGLTTAAEDIDAIDIYPQGIYISTTGNFNVPKYGGGTLKGGDEDVIVFSRTANQYSMLIDSTTRGIAAGNDLTLFDYERHFAPDIEWFFMGFAKSFSYQQNSVYPLVSGQPNDVFIDERPFSGSLPYAVGTFWDAGASGFAKLDAIDLAKK